MSVTFFIAAQEVPMVKAYAHTQFPGLTDEDFAYDPYYQKDEQGYYTLVSAWPEAHMTGTTANAVLSALGYQPEESDCFPLDQLPEVRRRITQALNTRARIERNTLSPHREGNVHFCGLSDERIRRQLGDLQAVVVKAMEEGCDVVWG